jgi:ABC-type nitrate/sulfonate/bicarbonate transport system ATPase subunit
MSIAVHNVDFFYDGTQILKGIDIDIPSGEIWSLLGRSGIGKTTLLQIIAGLFAPQSGTVKIEGETATPGLIKGIVFQDDSLLGWLSVRENASFPFRQVDKEFSTKIDSALSSVGLLDHANLFPAELSEGMKKRLEFIRALTVDREFLLADEPFGPVDAVTRRILWRLWKKHIVENPRTGILSTHDPEEALRLSRAVIILGSTRPTTCVSIIRIPETIVELDVDQESEELWMIKKRILDLLRQDGNGSTI